MAAPTEETCEARNQALRILIKIQQDTATMGSDYGMPHVARWAKFVEKIIQDFWL